MHPSSSRRGCGGVRRGGHFDGFLKGYNEKFFENAVRRLKPVAKLGPRAEINILELKFSEFEHGTPLFATKMILRSKLRACTVSTVNFPIKIEQNRRPAIVFIIIFTIIFVFIIIFTIIFTIRPGPGRFRDEIP